MEPHKLDRGRDIFQTALKLLEEPQRAYERGDEAVRAILNRVFFTRLYVDGQKISGSELQEPFHTLTEAYRVYRMCRTWMPAQRQQEPQTGTSPAVQGANDGADPGQSSRGPLARTSAVQGWSKPLMVGDTGIEPVTSSV